MRTSWLMLVLLSSLAGCGGGNAPAEMGAVVDMVMKSNADLTGVVPPDLTPFDQVYTGDLTNTHIIMVAPQGIHAFNPKTLFINTGVTVRWIWETAGDTVNSGAFGALDDKFCSPNDQGCAAGTNAPGAFGDTYEHTFNTPGVYPYTSRITQGMDGTITIQ
jgi:plastocyanin